LKASSLEGAFLFKEETCCYFFSMMLKKQERVTF